MPLNQASPASWVATFALLACVLAACEEGEPDDPPPQLRPGAHILLDAGATAAGNLLVRQHHLVNVNDVVRDGKRTIVELVTGWTSLATFHPPAQGCSSCGTTIAGTGGSTGYTVLTTDDDGGSWIKRPLALPTDIKLGMFYGSAGIHAAAGRVTWVPIYRSNDSAWELLRDIDLETGQSLSNSKLIPHMMMHARAYGGGIGASTMGYQNGETIVNLTTTWYDMASGHLEWGAQGVPPTQYMQAPVVSLAGNQFTGIGFDAAHGQTCLLAATAQGLPSPVECVDFSRWPVWLKTSAVPNLVGVTGVHHNLVISEGKVWAVYTRKGSLYAVPLETPLDPSRALALGEGGLDPDRGLHPHFGDFIKVGPRRLIALTAAGAQEVSVEPPCVADSQCAKAAELYALVPLQGNEAIVLWKVDTLGGLLHHEYIIARKETVVRTPLKHALPKPDPGPLAFYPSAKPAPKLIQRCAMAEHCFPGYGMSWLACRNRFAGLPPDNAVLQKFLTSPAGTCAELAQAWPERALLGKPCKSGCVGNTLIQACTDQKISQADDCGRYDGICTQTSGKASCTKNQTPFSCTASGCAGDRLIACNTATHTGVQVDCALDDQTCGKIPAGQTAAGQWNCLPRGPLDPEDCGGTPGHPVDDWKAVCVGNRYLTWCGKGERQVVDCVGLGGTGCTTPVGSMGACK